LLVSVHGLGERMLTVLFAVPGAGPLPSKQAEPLIPTRSTTAALAGGPFIKA
jgi:hypothetical protein